MVLGGFCDSDCVARAFRYCRGLFHLDAESGRGPTLARSDPSALDASTGLLGPNMYCTRCGAANPDDGTFCVRCGDSLANPYQASLAGGWNTPRQSPHNIPNYLWQSIAVTLCCCQIFGI